MVSLNVRSALRDLPGLISPEQRQAQKEALKAKKADSEAKEEININSYRTDCADEVLAPTEGELDYCTLLNRFSFYFFDYYLSFLENCNLFLFLFLFIFILYYILEHFLKV